MRRERDIDHLTAGELAVLAALAAGYTDLVVARRLGISGRTLRRRVAAAKEALRATSRFHAGVRAVQTGLVSPDGCPYGDEEVARAPSEMDAQAH